LSPHLNCILRRRHELRPARSALPRKRVRCVLGMLSSLEVKVFCPTWWRWRA